MPGKVSAKDATVLINGYDLSTLSTMYEFTGDVGAVDVTGFQQVTNFTPGLLKIDGKMDMIWDSAVNKSHLVMSVLPTGVVTIIPESYVLGAPTVSFPFMAANYNVKGDPANAIRQSGLTFRNYGASSVGEELGYALAHGTIAATTTGTGYDDPTGAAVTAACGASIHIWTPTSTDTYVVKVQHSTLLGSGYADLITFSANGTSRTAERQVVASGTVNRYRRIIATRTGSAADPFGFTVVFNHQ